MLWTESTSSGGVEHNLIYDQGTQLFHEVEGEAGPLFLLCVQQPEARIEASGMKRSDALA